MIAKIIPIKSIRKSNFSALVKYLTDPQGKTERIGKLAVTNCYTDELVPALLEIQNTQEMNKRAKSDKTCHLVLSFPEGERLSNDQLNEIEERFCEALGFHEHQRISVVHDDTDNLHIHIAINKIHPRKLTIHNPYYDYKRVATLCEQIEQEYGLTKVNHETRADKAERIIQDIEAKAGVESLLGWIRRECFDEIKQTDTWQDLHKLLHNYSLEIKERGNGLVFVSGNGVAVKASSVDRSLSKPNLIKRLGAFEPAIDTPQTNTQSAQAPKSKAKHYQPRPLQSKVDTSKLYERYQQQQANAALLRKEQWLKLREQRDLLIERAKHEARSKRSVIKHVQAGPLGKKALYATVSLQFKTTLDEVKRDYREAYAQLKTDSRRMSWLDWLTVEAKSGNAEALAVLRARSNRRNGTGAVLRDSIAGKKYNNNQSRTYNIESVTKDGTVFYKAGTMAVRDDGKRLFVSQNTSNESLADVLQVAINKYGNHLSVNGSDAFKSVVVRTAVQNRIRVTFDDPELERHRRQLSRQVVFQKRSKKFNASKESVMNQYNPGFQENRNATKDALIIRLLAIAFLIGGFQVATQYFAHQFNYQDQLGSHFNQLYAPWSILMWSNQWYDQHPGIFDLAAGYGILFSSVGLILVLIVKMMLANSSRANRNLYGSARWANKKDIEAAGLLSSKKNKGGESVYVGAWRDQSGKAHYLKHSGPEHVLCFAPTRSGKGVSLVIPTLLSWTQSAVITDLKGELWALTAGWRKHYANNSVLRFDPASTSSCHWNPLDEIIIGSGTEVADVQNLVNLIVDPDGKGLETHWQKTAHALLVGLILHVLYQSERDGTLATLPAVDALLSDPDRDIRELWMEMIMPESGNAHPVVAASAKDMLDRPEEEAGSVLSTAKSYLALYRDPIVANNISDSDFCIRDLMHQNNPVSLYIVSHPNDKSRLRPLLRILINMIVRKLAGQMAFQNGEPVTHYKHRLLLMLDEFPSLGKLEIFQESLAFIAGYGIKAYLICQDINQLKSRESGYGHDEAITSNCHIQTAFAPNRIETAEHLSKLTGQTTVIKEQITTSGRRSSMMHGHVTRTLQETQRALLTPDECMRLPGATKDASGRITKSGDMIIYVAGYPAIYGVQPLYFQDEVFATRAKVDPPLSSDRMAGSYDGVDSGTGTGTGTGAGTSGL